MPAARTNHAKKTAPKKKTVAINVELPIHLHRALRVKAIGEGLTLEHAVAAAIGSWTRTKV